MSAEEPRDTARRSNPGTRPSAFTPAPLEISARVESDAPDTTRGSAPATDTRSGHRPAPPAAADGGIPGYEILGELGRGGMGVVYKAKHVKLNRLVALKMAFDTGVDQKDLIRFLAEAEAVAAVKHDNVVQVYDYGDSGGRPYMALEFCRAGSLSELLRAEAPLDPLTAAEVVEKIAQGVAAAHEQGIVHRDLKPANILLQIAPRHAALSSAEVAELPIDELTPKVSDFGLAKRAVSDLTATQAVMGTPSYMSPEQALGRAKYVGPPADVWALGVILYEALTGARPFRGESTYEVLAQIMTDEPPPVRSVTSKVSGDLDLICRKCLEKAAVDRYPTARELADDLGRFLRREPISIRPAGVLERAAKWVRRNKLAAASLAAVAIALVVGAGVSLAFGLEARAQAAEATRQKREADEAAEREKAAAARAAAAAGQATAEAARADRERREAVNARNELQGTLARALRSPLNAKYRDSALTPYEADALRELAALRNTPVADRFLAEATRTPLACEQLECRAEFALHAAVGLDRAARDRADQLLLARLTHPETPPDQRASLALVVSRWEAADPRVAAAAADTLVAALLKNPDFATESMHKRGIGIGALAPRLAPKHRTEVCSSAANWLVNELARTRFTTTAEQAVEALAPLIPHLPPDRAAAVSAAAAQALANSLAKAKSDYDVRAVAKGLAELAPYLPRERAAELAAPTARQLIDLSAQSTDAPPVSFLNEALAEIAPLLTPEQTAQAARQVADTMAKTTAAVPLARLADHLVLLARRLPAEQAEPLLADAAAKTANFSALVELTKGLTAVAALLPADRATAACAPVAKRLTATLPKATQAQALQELAERLAALAPYLPPDQAATSCTAALVRLSDALSGNYDTNGLRMLAKGVTAVAPRLPADRAADGLAGAIGRTTDAFALRELAQGLTAAVSRLPRARALTYSTTAAERLLDVLTRTTEKHVHNALAEGVADLAVHLPRDRAAALCDKAAQRLADEMSKTTEPYAVSFYARSLTRVTAYLPADRATAMRVRACRQIVAISDPTLDGHTLGTIAEDLVAIAWELPREHLAPATQRLLDSMRQTKTDYSHKRVTRTLWNIAHGISSAEPDVGRDAGLLAVGSLASHRLLPTLPLFHPHFQPQPKPLPPQDLVELLKHPFCVGDAQRVVLDALERTYKQSFKDQWEFVEYAKKNQPHLDLLTPPKRPEPKT